MPLTSDEQQLWDQIALLQEIPISADIPTPSTDFKRSNERDEISLIVDLPKLWAQQFKVIQQGTASSIQVARELQFEKFRTLVKTSSQLLQLVCKKSPPLTKTEVLTYKNNIQEKINNYYSNAQNQVDSDLPLAELKAWYDKKLKDNSNFPRATSTILETFSALAKRQQEIKDAKADQEKSDDRTYERLSNQLKVWIESKRPNLTAEINSKAKDLGIATDQTTPLTNYVQYVKALEKNSKLDLSSMRNIRTDTHFRGIPTLALPMNTDNSAINTATVTVLNLEAARLRGITHPTEEEKQEMANLVRALHKLEDVSKLTAAAKIILNENPKPAAAAKSAIISGGKDSVSDVRAAHDKLIDAAAPRTYKFGKATGAPKTEPVKDAHAAAAPAAATPTPPSASVAAAATTRPISSTVSESEDEEKKARRMLALQADLSLLEGLLDDYPLSDFLSDPSEKAYVKNQGAEKLLKEQLDLKEKMDATILLLDSNEKKTLDTIYKKSNIFGQLAKIKENFDKAKQAATAKSASPLSSAAATSDATKATPPVGKTAPASPTTEALSPNVTPAPASTVAASAAAGPTTPSSPFMTWLNGSSSTITSLSDSEKELINHVMYLQNDLSRHIHSAKKTSAQQQDPTRYLEWLLQEQEKINKVLQQLKGSEKDLFEKKMNIAEIFGKIAQIKENINKAKSEKTTSATSGPSTQPASPPSATATPALPKVTPAPAPDLTVAAAAATPPTTPPSATASATVAPLPTGPAPSTTPDPSVAAAASSTSSASVSTSAKKKADANRLKDQIRFTITSLENWITRLEDLVENKPFTFQTAALNTHNERVITSLGALRRQKSSIDALYAKLDANDKRELQNEISDITSKIASIELKVNPAKAAASAKSKKSSSATSGPGAAATTPPPTTPPVGGAASITVAPLPTGPASSAAASAATSTQTKTAPPKAPPPAAAAASEAAGSDAAKSTSAGTQVGNATSSSTTTTATPPTTTPPSAAATPASDKDTKHIDTSQVELDFDESAANENAEATTGGALGPDAKTATKNVPPAVAPPPLSDAATIAAAAAAASSPPPPPSDVSAGAAAGAMGGGAVNASASPPPSSAAAAAASGAAGTPPPPPPPITAGKHDTKDAVSDDLEALYKKYYVDLKSFHVSLSKSDQPILKSVSSILNDELKTAAYKDSPLEIISRITNTTIPDDKFGTVLNNIEKLKDYLNKRKELFSLFEKTTTPKPETAEYKTIASELKKPPSKDETQYLLDNFEVILSNHLTKEIQDRATNLLKKIGPKVAITAQANKSNGIHDAFKHAKDAHPMRADRHKNLESYKNYIEQLKTDLTQLDTTIQILENRNTLFNLLNNPRVAKFFKDPSFDHIFSVPPNYDDSEALLKKMNYVKQVLMHERKLELDDLPFVVNPDHLKNIRQALKLDTGVLSKIKTIDQKDFEVNEPKKDYKSNEEVFTDLKEKLERTSVLTKELEKREKLAFLLSTIPDSEQPKDAKKKSEEGPPPLSMLKNAEITHNNLVAAIIREGFNFVNASIKAPNTSFSDVIKNELLKTPPPLDAKRIKDTKDLLESQKAFKTLFEEARKSILSADNKNRLDGLIQFFNDPDPQKSLDYLQRTTAKNAFDAQLKLLTKSGDGKDIPIHRKFYDLNVKLAHLRPEHKKSGTLPASGADAKKAYEENFKKHGHYYPQPIDSDDVHNEFKENLKTGKFSYAGPSDEMLKTFEQPQFKNHLDEIANIQKLIEDWEEAGKLADLTGDAKNLDLLEPPTQKQIESLKKDLKNAKERIEKAIPQRALAHANAFDSPPNLRFSSRLASHLNLKKETLESYKAKTEDELKQLSNEDLDKKEKDLSASINLLDARKKGLAFHTAKPPELGKIDLTKEAYYSEAGNVKDRLDKGDLVDAKSVDSLFAKLGPELDQERKNLTKIRSEFKTKVLDQFKHLAGFDFTTDIAPHLNYANFKWDKAKPAESIADLVKFDIQTKLADLGANLFKDDHILNVTKRALEAIEHRILLHEETKQSIARVAPLDERKALMQQLNRIKDPTLEEAKQIKENLKKNLAELQNEVDRQKQINTAITNALHTEDALKNELTKHVGDLTLDMNPYTTGDKKAQAPAQLEKIHMALLKVEEQINLRESLERDLKGIKATKVRDEIKTRIIEAKKQTDLRDKLKTAQKALQDAGVTLSEEAKVKLAAESKKGLKVGVDSLRKELQEKPPNESYEKTYARAAEVEKKLDDLERKAKSSSAKSDLDYDEVTKLRTETKKAKREAKRGELCERLLDFPYTSFDDFLKKVCKRPPPLDKDTLDKDAKDHLERYYARIVHDFSRVAGAPIDAGLRNRLDLDDFIRKSQNLSETLANDKKSTHHNLKQRLFDELAILNESKIMRNLNDAKIVLEQPSSEIAQEYIGFTMSFAHSQFPVEFVDRTDQKNNDLLNLLEGKLSSSLSSGSTPGGLFGISTGPDHSRSAGGGLHRIIDTLDESKVAVRAFSKDKDGKTDSGFANFFNTEKHAYVSQVFAEKKEMKMSYHLANALLKEAADFNLILPGQMGRDEKGKLQTLDGKELLQLRMQFFDGLLYKLQHMPYPNNQVTKDNLLNILKSEVEQNNIRAPGEQFQLDLGTFQGRNLGKFAETLFNYLEQKTTQVITLPGTFRNRDVVMPRNEYFDVALRMISSLLADSNHKGPLYFYNQTGNPQLLQAMRIVADANGIVYKDQTGYGFPPTTENQIAAYGVLCNRVDFKQDLVKETKGQQGVQERVIGWLMDSKRADRGKEAKSLFDLLEGDRTIARPTNNPPTLG